MLIVGEKLQAITSNTVDHLKYQAIPDIWSQNQDLLMTKNYAYIANLNL